MTKRGVKESEVINVPVRNVSVAGSIATLAKSAVGPGAVVLATVMHKMGLGLGIGTMIFAAIMASVSLHFLARLSANTDVNSYFGLGKMALGQFGEVSVLICLCLFLMGGLIFYAALIGKYLHSSLLFITGADVNAWFLKESFLTIVVGLFFIFPLSCLKDMSSLAKTSIAGMGCMVYLAVLVVADYFFNLTPASSLPINYFKFDGTFFTGVSSLLFAYMNHFTIVSIVPVMINPTPKRRAIVIAGSTLVSTILYLAIGICGYLHFQSDVVTRGGGNILNAPAVVTWPYGLGQLAVAIVIIFSFPLLVEPGRATIDKICCLIAGDSPRWNSMSAIRHFGITGLLVLVSHFIAVTASGLVMDILNVFNAVCGSLLMFIFPSIYFLRLGYRYPVNIIERILAYVSIFLGTVVLIFGAYFSVDSMVKNLLQK